MRQFIVKDPNASVRTRNAIAALANAVSVIAPRLETEVSFSISLTSGIANYTVTMTGAALGNIVLVAPMTEPPASVASWSGVVSAANTVKIRLLVSSGPGGTATQVFRVVVIGMSE